MPRIFDNIDQPLLPALRETLALSDRADFCVGYFNLRGWKQIDEQIERWSGDPGHCCRLLVGMQRLPQEDLREALSILGARDGLDNQTALRLKQTLAEAFRQQLILGTRTNGNVPYLNGGLFELHPLEEKHADIEIPDEAFEHLFGFFDQYGWHLDTRSLSSRREITPDVLGYIFEKYINQKQKGAYYTKEDITEYISKSTITPYLFDAAQKTCAIVFQPNSTLWQLLRDDPDRYIYAPVCKGVDLPLLEDVARGIEDISRRGGWNRPAAPAFALPTETWREHVARRQRCLREVLYPSLFPKYACDLNVPRHPREMANVRVEAARGGHGGGWGSRSRRSPFAGGRLVALDESKDCSTAAFGAVHSS